MQFPNTNIEVVRRHNKPSGTSKSYLEFFLLEGGSPTDAYAISSVHVFPQLLHSVSRQPEHYFLDNTASSPTYGVVAPASEPDATFAFSSTDEFADASPTLGAFSFNDVPGAWYDGSPLTASSIFRLGTGHYAVVLQPDASCTIDGVYQPNESSSTGDYFDVWTLVNTANTSATVFINSFNLGASHWTNLTEPLMAKAKNKLGSMQQIIMSTNITILNRNIPHEMKTTLSRTIIDSAGYNIFKYNEDGRPGMVLIAGYEDTKSQVHLTSDDTLVYLFDTDVLRSAAFHSGDSNDIGSPHGIYYIQAVYKCFDQIILSEEFPLIIE